MKKKNNKGFLLIETLIVSTFITSTMIFLFIQFRRVNSTFNRTFSYNTVKSLYALSNINQFIMDNDYEGIMSRMASDENVSKLPYAILLDDDGLCSEVYITNTDYCNKLVQILGIEELYITSEDLSLNNFLNNLDNYGDFDVETKKFIRYIKYDEATTTDEMVKMRTIAKFKDGSYATLKLYRRD